MTTLCHAIVEWSKFWSWKIHLRGEFWATRTPETSLFLYVNRGGSRIFLRRGCTSKEWHHWRWGEKNLKANMYTRRRKLHLRGGGVCNPCTLPLDLPLNVILKSTWYFWLIRDFNPLKLIITISLHSWWKLMIKNGSCRLIQSPKAKSGGHWIDFGDKNHATVL